MSDLISRQKVIKRIEELPNSPNGYSATYDKASIIMAIEDVEPVADVAPVVRCKDCKYGEIDDPDFPNQYFCHYYGDDWNEGEHFCSNGERKE